MNLKNISLTFFISIIVFIGLNGCTKSTLSINTKTKTIILPLNGKVKKQFKVTFDKANFHDYSNRCLDEYMIVSKFNQDEYGQIIIDHKVLNSDCEYNGAPDNYAIEGFMNYFKAKKVKKIAEKKYNNYQFNYYTANLFGLNQNITLIEYWNANTNTFIFDLKGKLSKELKDNLEKNK